MHPKDHKFSLEKAKDLVRGEFYLEEEKEDERMRGLNNYGVNNGPVLLGREGLN